MTPIAAAALVLLAAAPAPRTPEEEIRGVLERAEAPRASIGDLRRSLGAFYAARGLRPAWLSDGRPTSQAHAVAALLASAAGKGLDPDDYDGSRWYGELVRLGGGASPADQATFDVGLTASVLRYASDLRRGCVDPRSLGFELGTERRAMDLPALAAELVSSEDPAAVLDALEPRMPAYHRLLDGLARYRELAAILGDRAAVAPPRVAPRPGEPYAGAGAVASRLLALGDLPASELGAAGEGVFTDGLAAAVARFQARHGLAADGRFGPRTAAALNVPLSRRVRQIEITLERWRWMPHDIAPPLLVVNIPQFRLVAVEGGGASMQRALAMDVIVGDEYPARRTPVFARRMSHVVFSPYWEVPNDLLERELVPRWRKDPGYFDRLGFFVETAEGQGPVTRKTLAEVLAGRGRVRQPPGPGNPLGGAKFVFPNEFAVYLHDTPERGLFSRADRALSNGCVRVSDAAGLAEYLLRGKPGWDRARIERAMAAQEPEVVRLDERPWVFVVYGTAYADPEGVLYFFPDVYGHDAVLERALARS
jgi:murein L,D-transpeptidase YcbB/YkuD